MRIEIHAVGRLKSGPERELADRYLDRLAKAGPAIGLQFGELSEAAESRARSANERRSEEARDLEARLPAGSALVLLDERGKDFTSEQFAEKIGALRDSGRKQLVLAIGGPDGHDASLRAKAELVMSLGQMTWPHQIARILLAEQLYRATTILSGHPYHRA